MASSDILSWASRVESDVVQIHKTIAKTVNDRTAAQRALSNLSTAVTEQRRQEQKVAGMPLDNPPLCSQVQGIDGALAVEVAAYGQVQQDQALFAGAEGVYQDDLDILGVNMVQLSGDIENLVAAIADAKGHKVPKIPVNLYGKHNVQDLVKVVSALLNASRLIPNTLAERAKARIAEAQAISAQAQQVDQRAHAQGCTPP